MPVTPQRFKFIGGWPCLDFVDSKNWDSQEAKYERFQQYDDLVWWNIEADFLPDKAAQALFERARLQPDRAATVFEQGLRLRDEVHRCLAEIAAGKGPETIDLSRLNAWIGQSVAQSQLAAEGERFRWQWSGQPDALERVLWPIVWSTAELLTSDQLGRVKQCAGESCGWIFLDTTKNGSRRWCEMGHCGNRAKAKRYYWRLKAKT